MEKKVKINNGARAIIRNGVVHGPGQLDNSCCRPGAMYLKKIQMQSTGSVYYVTLLCVYEWQPLSISRKSGTPPSGHICDLQSRLPTKTACSDDVVHTGMSDFAKFYKKKMHFLQI